ncbi:phage tail protein [Octadecabacter sp. G9-8]|uniref:Phage tail protein n=1 Tax=Octadecabacter dasysiphoniae TaxID=2909341 RepID=A0ABS9CZ33_9RHOB|nr:phage tail protein [Octadecabacter dasysiphoniae]MCF2872064.1 phage tail protein [Octadecabacter dasysiphoniae]
MNNIPPASFTFSVAFGDQPQDHDAVFKDLAGIETSREVTAISEGDAYSSLHRLPTGVRQTNVTLKRGVLTANFALLAWVKTSIEDNFSTPIQPKSVIITLLDQDQAPVVAWTLNAAWPVKLQAGALDATSSKVAVETLEFARNSISKKALKSDI